MKKLIVIFVFIFCNYFVYSQETCGYDFYLNKIISDNSSKSDFDKLREAIRGQILQETQLRTNSTVSNVTQQNNYTIPVVFHLVGTNASALTDAQVQTQLNLLNQAFSNSLGSTYGVSDDAQIQFCLAQTLPNGQAWSNIGGYNSNLFYNGTPGITRCTTSFANTISSLHNMNANGQNSQAQLVNIAYNGFSFSNYLNIWVVNNISEVETPYTNSVVGYAPFPLLGSSAYLDGVVMRLDGFGLNSGGMHYNQGRTLIHEVGHYLGLFHTFQFGCTEVTDGTACNASGDECCDTPPVALPNQNSCSILLNSSPNSCGETPDLPDMYENHMDYAWDLPGTCRNTFTLDQVDRMHATIQLYRSNLVSFQNLIATGVATTGCLAGVISPIFITNLPGNTKQVCLNQSVGFIASSGASSYNWSFPGGVPSSMTGTNLPSNIIYSTPGTYNVTLNITDGTGASFSSTTQIFVSNCIPYTGTRGNWYFGYNCALSFATGIPTPVSPSAIGSDEESATISSNSGNLLFYTHGRSVYGANHSYFPNGNNTLNGSPNQILVNGINSSSQGVVIVPRPGNPNRYYIYTNSDSPYNPGGYNTGYGISQYEVDMTLNGNLGDLVSTTAHHPLQNYATTEPIAAVPHCNGTDYWLVVKPINNTQSGLANPGSNSTVNSKVAAYLINSSGVSDNPVLSSSGVFTIVDPPTHNFQWSGAIKVSPDKKFMCFGENGTLGQAHLYYFDCATGLLNYITTFNNYEYGLEFSPNSKVLYTKSGNNIIQYDLSNITICNTQVPTKTFSTRLSGYSGGTLQLGPDGKIYVTYNLQNKLGVINFPNVINSTNVSNECGYNYMGIPLLSGQTVHLDLPNDITGQIGLLPDEFTFSVRNCGQACFSNLGCGTTFTWNFGDGYIASGVNSSIPAGTNSGTTTGNFEYPFHTYSSPGTYTVTLSVDGRPIVSHTITITSPPPPPTITGPTIICSYNTGFPSSYFAPAGYSYIWNATNASNLSGNQQAFNTTWTIFPATVTLTIINNQGCSSSTSIVVNKTQAIVNALTTAGACSNSICDATVNASSSGGLAPFVYVWNESPIQTGAQATGLCTGTHTVTTTDANGCSSSVTYTIGVNSANNYDYLSTRYNPLMLSAIPTPSDQNGDGKIIIQGPLYVDVNYTLNNKTWYFEDNPDLLGGIIPDLGIPPSGVVVMPGKTLTLDNTIFTSSSACDMWYGVQVWGKPAAKKVPASYGKLVVKNQSIIQNAHIGVSCYRSTPQVRDQTEYGMGILQAYGKSKFINNNISVDFHGWTLINNSSYINDCEFICNNPLIDPVYSGQGMTTFIRLNSVKQPSFRGNLFTNTYNSFAVDQRGMGIQSYNAAFNVVKLGNVGNTFTDLTYGISTNATGGIKNLNVTGNTFNNVQQAITTVGTNYDNITGNTFNIPDYTLIDTWGVYLNGTEGFNVSDANSFNKCLACVAGTVAGKGVIVQNGGVFAGTIKNNSFSNLESATQSEDNNGNSSGGLQIKCNTYTNNSYAIDISPQGLGTPSLADQGTGCAQLDDRPTNSFVLGCSGESDIRTSINFKYYENSNNLNPSTCITSTVTTFSNYQDCSTSLGAFSDNCNSGTGGCTTPACLQAQRNQMEHEQDLIKKKQMLHELIIGHILSNSPNAEIVIRQLLQAWNTDETKKILVPMLIDAGEFDGAETILFQILQNNQENIRFKQLYEILIDLGRSGKPIKEMSQAQELVVRDVANSQTLVKYHAQAVLVGAEKEHYTRVPERTLTSLARIAKTENNNITTINNDNKPQLFINYPNPFEESTVIKYYLPENQISSELVITDITGRLIQKYELEKGNNNVEFKTGDLKAGVYYYSMYVYDKLIDCKKMILIK